MTGKKSQRQKWYQVFEGGRREAGDYLTEWIEDDISPPNTAKNTYLSFKYAVVKHIIPSLGHIPLQQLTRAHVKAFLREKEKTLVARRKHAHTLKKSTVRLLRDVLHSALADAVDDDLVRRNPAAIRDKQRRKRHRQEPGHVMARTQPKPKAWTEEQQRALIEASRVDCQMHALVSVALDSGMRKNEVLGLKWTDFQPHPKVWWDESQLNALESGAMVGHQSQSGDMTNRSVLEQIRTKRPSRYIRRNSNPVR